MFRFLIHRNLRRLPLSYQLRPHRMVHRISKIDDDDLNALASDLFSDSSSDWSADNPCTVRSSAVQETAEIANAAKISNERQDTFSSMEFDDLDDEELDLMLSRNSHMFPGISRMKKIPSPIKIEKKPLNKLFTSSPVKATDSSYHSSQPSPTWHRNPGATVNNMILQNEMEHQAKKVKSSPTRCNLEVPFLTPTKKRITYNVSGQSRGISTRNSTIELMTQMPRDLQKLSQEDAKLDVKSVKPIILSEEQNRIIRLCLSGVSLFYTGSAGTGKSVLLRSLIKALREQHGQGTVAVTASTGLAACHIGGITLHSFAGIGLGKGSAKDLVKKIRRARKVLQKWKSIKVLVIDEISMIDGALLDKLNEIAKILRRSDDPFGGIQLIVCGDFYQLPPVSKDSSQPADFAFESAAWKECISCTIILQKVFRQEGDTGFIEMLNQIRDGTLSETVINQFQQLCRPLSDEDGIVAAELFPTRKEVDYANLSRLKRLPEELVVYKSFDSGSLEEGEQRQRLLSNFMAPQVLDLKKGSQVMMLKNMDETLVNGSLGRIVDFVDPDTYFFYKKLNSFEEEDIIKRINRNVADEKEDLQTEKRLISNADSLTSRKLDTSVFDFLEESKDIETTSPGVAEDFERKKALVQSLYEHSKGKRLPLVRFLMRDGNTRTVLVQPEKFEIEDENENALVSRVQLPLVLAWSLSIHKSQGQTLPKVKVNLRNVFEKGQAYVALSRAVSREGLQVLNFHPSKIMTHSTVVDFYKRLTSVEEAIQNLKR